MTLIVTIPNLHNRLQEHCGLPVYKGCVSSYRTNNEFPAQRAISAENLSIWWSHHGIQAGRDQVIKIWGIESPNCIRVVAQLVIYRSLVLKWYEYMPLSVCTLKFCGTLRAMPIFLIYSCRRNLINKISFYWMFVSFCNMLQLVFNFYNNKANSVIFLGIASIMSTLSLQFLVKCVWKIKYFI